MRYTQYHVHSLGIKYNSIYLQDFVAGPIRSFLGKLMRTTMQPGAQLVVVYGNTENQERFAIITQVGMALR